MSNSVKSIEFLNKICDTHLWHIDMNSNTIRLYLNPSNGIKIINILNNIGLKYETPSRGASVRLSIKVEDVISYIKVESRNDRISDLLK